MGELRSSLRNFTEVFTPPRAKLTPVVKSPRPQSGTPVEDSATASVRTSLQSVLTTVRQLATRLEGWSPDTAAFADGGAERTLARAWFFLKFNLNFINFFFSFQMPDAMEFEREVAANDLTTPRQIQEAALGITQAALKANSATASGRKLADISVAGEVIHKAANDLVRRLRCGTRGVMLAAAAGEGNLEKARCVAACGRAIEGGKSTLQELIVMLENMIKVSAQQAHFSFFFTPTQLFSAIQSLDDPGSGQPPAMQVTLAMRRLRETVYEIVEGVKQMPGSAPNDSGSSLLNTFFINKDTYFSKKIFWITLYFCKF